MASIEVDQAGGKLKLTASTKPTGHTIKVKELPSWITAATLNATTWTGSVFTNSEENSRTFTLTASAITNPDEAYVGTTYVVSSWTITQPGTGSTPPVVTDKILKVRLQYTGETNPSYPVFYVYYPNGAPISWTPTADTDSSQEYTFNLGPRYTGQIRVTAISEVHPYLTRLDGLLVCGSPSIRKEASETGTGYSQIYVDLDSGEFEFDSTDTAYFTVTIHGEN